MNTTKTSNVRIPRSRASTRRLAGRGPFTLVEIRRARRWPAWRGELRASGWGPPRSPGGAAASLRHETAAPPTAPISVEDPVAPLAAA
jgi:hypothetical protein